MREEKERWKPIWRQRPRETEREPERDREIEKERDKEGIGGIYRERRRNRDIKRLFLVRPIPKVDKFSATLKLI